MEIKAGKYYRTRDGRKAGPMMSKNNYLMHCPGWEGDWYADDGRRGSGPERCDDLIAEWTDEPAAPKTWGEMTDDEKKALLLANHEGKVIEKLFPVAGWREIDGPAWRWDCAYRVRPPEPVREAVTLIGNADRGFDPSGWEGVDQGNTHRITFATINGYIPTGIYTNEDGERIVVERVND